VDEYFEFPFSRQINLHGFLDYLNTGGYSGVILQSIDLFADKTINNWPQTGDELRSQCIWYDHSIIIFPKTRQNFGMNRVSSQRIQPCSGGIKKVVFDVDRLLTKHALIFYNKGARLNGPHHSRNAYIADVSCALLHYPFNGRFREKCMEAVQKGQYWRNSVEYWKFLDVLGQYGSQFSLKRSTAKKLSSLNQLIDEGFLVVSEEYTNYVQGLAHNGSPPEKTSDI
jgi:hypothetical protein